MSKRYENYSIMFGNFDCYNQGMKYGIWKIFVKCGPWTDVNVDMGSVRMHDW